MSRRRSVSRRRSNAVGRVGPLPIFDLSRPVGSYALVANEHISTRLVWQANIPHTSPPRSHRKPIKSDSREATLSESVSRDARRRPQVGFEPENKGFGISGA